MSATIGGVRVRIGIDITRLDAEAGHVIDRARSIGLGARIGGAR